MFAQKLRTEVVGRAVLIAVILFGAVSPNAGFASPPKNSQEETSNTNSEQDIQLGLDMGFPNAPVQEKVPVLSEQLAARQQAQDKPVRFKVWAEPAIYTPGVPITLNWKVQNLQASDLEIAEVVIHAAEGLSSADINPTYTPDGLVTVALKNKKDFSTWNAAEDVELPIYFTLDLLVNDDLIAYQTVMVDQASLSIEKNKGGKISGLNGKVEVEVPASAINETLEFAVREPAPQTQPGISLTWEPLEVIAVEKTSHKNVNKFKTPIKITVNYDETKIFEWDENALAIYYYDEDLLDWFPLDTTVDTKNNTLVAYSDHLTVFDYKARACPPLTRSKFRILQAPQRMELTFGHRPDLAGCNLLLG